LRMIEIVLGQVAAPGFVSACRAPMRGQPEQLSAKMVPSARKKAPASSRGFRDFGGLDQ
jgi:hypothetical protein